jgi:hypothetical protein
VQPSTPGAPPAATSGERYKVGKYELSEAEVGELITTKAAEDSRKLTLPTSAEKYEPTLPADFVSPPGIAAAIDTKDPLFAQAQQFAHRHHLSQDQFSDLLGVYAGQQVEREMFLAKARAAEAAKLGPAASQRVASVQQFLKGQIGSELAAEVNMMLVTSGAVRAIEVLMAKFTNQGSAAFSQAGRAPPDAPGSIPGYESMNFIQRRAAQDAALQRRR